MYESFTVFDFMMYLALLKGIEEPEEHITNLLLRCKLEKFSDQVIGKLSGGAVKRASLATSLIGDPKIIFLDEPSSGVDVANRKEVWDFLTSLKSKERVILLTTHQLEEAEHISQDIVIMHKGVVDIRGTPSDITSKYGIGYRLCISGVKTEIEKKKLHKELLAIEPEIDIVGDQNFNETGTFEVILPTKKEEMIREVVEHLENENIKFYLNSNSLEEAFINLGERKKEHNAEEIDLVFSKLFSKSFDLTKSRVLKVLVFRRFKLLLGSTENWMRMVYLSVLPALVATVIKRGGSFNR